MKFEDFWSQYWGGNGCKDNWMPDSCREIARVAFEAGRQEVMANMSEKALIKYLDKKYGIVHTKSVSTQVSDRK